MATRGRPKKLPADKNIENALGLAEQEIDKLMPVAIQNQLIPYEEPVITVGPPKLSKDAQSDYDFARTNLHSLLEKGNRLLQGITDLAADSDHPRTFEVAGILLKTLLDGTRELMVLQKDILDVEKKSGVVTDKGDPLTIEHADSVTNVLVEASTLELLEFIDQQRKK